FERGYRAMGWGLEADGAGADPATMFDRRAGDCMLAALVTAELIALLSGFGVATAARGLARVFAPGHRAELYDLHPESDCAACGVWKADGEIDVVESYEWAERREPDAITRRTPPRSAAQLRKAAATLARSGHLTSAPRLRLPELSNPAVTHLLRRTAGWRPVGEPGTPARHHPADDDVP